MQPDDFEARWRAAARADPGHATYPEAVPGYRASRAARRRAAPAKDPGAGTPHIGDPWTPEPDDAAVAFPNNGWMTVVWRKPEGVVPPVDAPPTVAEIRERAEPAVWLDLRGTEAEAELGAAEPFDSEAELVAVLATDDAVKALRDAIDRAGQPGRRWYDPRTWWRR